MEGMHHTPPSRRHRFARIALGVSAGVLLHAASGVTASASSDPPPEVAVPASLPTGHSHNDYYQPKPLLDALELGFGSIEVDVFPEGDALLVGHHERELKPERTLKALYLEPLLARCLAAGEATGPLPAGGRLTLLIDIKRHGERALEILLPALEPLRPWLRRVEGDRVIEGPIEVVLSGARPMKTVAALSSRSVFIDGRIGDLDANPSPALVPMISTAMHAALGTYGISGLDESARARLRMLVRRTHDQGRRLRFWGHVESRAVWTALVEADVDHIGTDRPKMLGLWLAGNDPRCDS